MGGFGGHALPGSFFIIFAIWFIVRIFQRYYSSRQRFTSTVMMDCSCLPARLKALPLEAFVKVFFITVGFSIEIFTGFVNGKFVIIGNAQHATMFFFFGLTGVIDILLYFRVPLPKDTDYISNALALGIEGLLFKFHLHGRTDLDIMIHTFLVYVIFLGVASVLVEMRYRHNILAALARSYFILLQGTWFWQIGFILYNPNPDAEPWKQEDPEQMMIATLYFTWHCGINFVFMLVTGVVIGCVYRRRYGDYDYNAKTMKKESNRESVLAFNDASDSDVEQLLQEPKSS